VENPIDTRWWILAVGIVGVEKVSLPAGFDHRCIALHHHVFRAGDLFDRRAGGAVIRMRMADQKNLYVGELETERLNTAPNQRHIRFEVAIDKNVSFGRGDQIIRQTLAADVVEIVCYAKCRKRFGPIVLRGLPSGNQHEREHNQYNGSQCGAASDDHLLLHQSTG